MESSLQIEVRLLGMFLVEKADLPIINGKFERHFFVWVGYGDSVQFDSCSPWII